MLWIFIEDFGIQAGCGFECATAKLGAGPALVG